MLPRTRVGTGQSKKTGPRTVMFRTKRPKILSRWNPGVALGESSKHKGWPCEKKKKKKKGPKKKAGQHWGNVPKLEKGQQPPKT